MINQHFNFSQQQQQNEILNINRTKIWAMLIFLVSKNINFKLR